MSITGLLLVSVLISGCAPASNFDARLEPIVSQYRFSIAGWEWQTAVELTKRALTPGQDNAAETGEVKVVTGYFEAIKRKTLDEEGQKKLAHKVETIIKRQIRETLNEQGIFAQVANQKIRFPPLSFTLEELPLVLVVSPRDRIESIGEVVLKSGIPLKEQENIEARVDKLGVSSLVEGLGGIATYPSMVDSGAGLRTAIETAAHEWLHQYLAYTPLGFRYILDETGLVRNYDIATMNESVADMFGEEIGEIVFRKYYSGYEDGAKKAEEPESTFNLEMREIRKAVDVYLARGEIEPAEAFMEQKRQELVSKGYHIRKLNQAYFAFHGTYADDPAFLNPIGLELKALRAKSASLKSFLDKVAGMTSRRDLTESVR